MKIPFDRVLVDWLALHGESPELLPLLEEGEDSAVLKIADELRVRIVDMAIKATLETPSVFLDEIVDYHTASLMDSSGVVLRMPDDYLKLHSLQMEDWKEKVTATEPEDTLRYALGANAPAWMICAERPMVKAERDSEGIALRVYGTRSTSPPLRLTYVPRPAFDGETLRVSAAAYHRLLQQE